MATVENCIVYPCAYSMTCLVIQTHVHGNPVTRVLARAALVDSMETSEQKTYECTFSVMIDSIYTILYYTI